MKSINSNAPLRIVIDTNILYAGFRSDLGASHAILEAVWAGRVVPLLNQVVITEYEEILKHYAPALGLALGDVDAILNFICMVGERVESSAPWTPVLADPDDEAFVKLAIFGRADCIVTHNLKHFAPVASLGIKLLAPREFLANIKT